MYFVVMFSTIGGNVLKLKEVRNLKPKYFLPPQKFISSRNTVLFFAYVKIRNFREATKCRQKTYINVSIFLGTVSASTIY